MAPSAPSSSSQASQPPQTQVPPQLHRTHSSSSKRRTLGDWDLLKTIGAGSMGKVKLARHRLSGELAAVKIVPRYVPEGQLQRHNPKYLPIMRAGPDGVSTEQPKLSSDESKEIRTIREAAIASLLDHRYICSLREVMAMTHHYYMVFENVAGGQMLDYIISHGRLKEKQARKFARQIASAIDYCHHNSVVHRDLKIENILISKSGDIKIIDFGLSNLYSPRSLLKTFCGSLYFAAPELLNSKQYIGPEVDIWSFGIVLYVLACGKVPFDDQSMPALHAKIKRGHVEYPNWLSPECKNLLSRMLVVDPKARATLAEIINHPWMLKGYDGPQDSYLPNRRPLTLPLDREVIKGMHGFEFGSDARIEAELTAVLESPEYQAACQAWYRSDANISGGSSGGGHFNAFLNGSLFDSSSGSPTSAHTPRKKSTFSFEFYKKRQSNTSPSSSQETLNERFPDPTNAYHPLISIYFLVREKQERTRRRPTLETAGSTRSVLAPLEAPVPTASSESSGAVPRMELAPPPEISSGEKQPRLGRLEIPVIPVPETAHTHSQPTARTAFPGRSRSVNHGHSGYIPDRSRSNVSTSPTSNKDSYPSPVQPQYSPVFSSSRQHHPTDLPTIPSESNSPDEFGHPTHLSPGHTSHDPHSGMNVTSPTSPSKRDGISIGGIFRRLSTRRQHRSNSMSTGGHSGGTIPPMSPSAGSASSDDERPPPLPTMEFNATYEDPPTGIPVPGSPQQEKRHPGVTFAPDHETRSGSGSGKQSGNAPQSFIRFERLFSRASNLGRSTSISEGTYNRRGSRVLN
ncbi:kinase-like domain-containing protein [Myxozyma melibiosi]|uniref:Kinase-like domain-containing protein n=1 Tax=Myxozyma melibiosi TaxID=54550 RepID=A0ABR1F468_9ASCO